MKKTYPVHSATIRGDLKNSSELSSLWIHHSIYSPIQILENNQSNRALYFTSYDSKDGRVPINRHTYTLVMLIAQAIYNSETGRLSWEEIVEWMESRNWRMNKQTNIQMVQRCLSLNKCFIKAVTHTGIVYWSVQLDQLKNTPFGQLLINTGISGGFEYWQPGDRNRFLHSQSGVINKSRDNDSLIGLLNELSREETI